jgi:hypothetical protein
VAGNYDNEAVAIFALIFTFHLYVKVCNRIVFLHFVPFFLILKFIAFNTHEMILQTLNTGLLFYAILNVVSNVGVSTPTLVSNASQVPSGQIVIPATVDPTHVSFQKV